jgi:hypothetical protein
MAKLGYVSTNDAYPANEFKPIPAGKYPAIILHSELCTNKLGTGQYIKLKWQIVEGDYHGRVIFSQHNVFHQNPQVENIGRGELQSFAKAAGIDPLEDSEDLHGKPMLVFVSVRSDKTGNYGDQNEIKRAEPYGDVPFDNPNSTPKSSFGNGPTHQNRNGGGVAIGGTGASHTSGMSAGAMQQRAAARPNTRSNPFAE